MSLVISDEIIRASGLSEPDFLLEIVLLLFKQKKISLAKASHLLGIPRIRFQHELASRQIPIHYDVEDFETDLSNLRAAGRL
ncbi:MAG: UPF0175 family protein [Coleofasciculus sp. D1-CHI-01]|uniref:Uncharacterized protein n=1 Tax=Coleofasciculus chthonoplastes PCC 7420 TaxID=118168 RepID=B4W122_9CYAN|nr:UPF0175 family protein [Coleofasciculus chthonoplastes]EDX72080.1 conserved hypothetical protein [Coleofasciculus chthonoplastes PCC 7420]